jgi:hypothetical protein
LEVEVHWEDALLESSEMRDGKSAVAEARHDEGPKWPFRSRQVGREVGNAVVNVPDTAPFPKETRRSADGMA